MLNENILWYVISTYNEAPPAAVTHNTETYSNMAPLAKLNGCTLWTVVFANKYI